MTLRPPPIPLALALALAAATALAATSASTSRAEDVTPLPIGAPLPDFRLPGVDGKTYTPGDFADAEVLVVVFTCNHCPTAQAYEGRIARLLDDYEDKGVALVAISPNDPLAVRLDELGYTDLGDSFEEMKIRAQDHGFNYPYLYDGETQETSRAFGVLATPHVFIFDRDRALRYQGRFDDSEVKEVSSHDAIDAVEALLAGRPVPHPTTRVFGCSTKWADKRASARESLARWDAEPVAIEPIGLEAVAELASNDTDDLLLVNLWATWCGPCVAELPELVTINRMYRQRDFRMITISLDDPEHRDKALDVLRKHHVSSTNYILDADDRDAFAEALDPSWPGPVPYTLLIAPGGKVINRQVGELDPLEVKRAIVEHLGRTY
ncbi:redoxin family protein [Tautonia sociabilis]|uniref:Redoxin domain-containing protein n=1 Tax=Tautonia sociabilis TaxID=2080755 RepID=A0A432MG39_9BACT|nr:redoxin family protein [Tautonia sociabilis]RUL85282.1 redoxin domain-containing protein [Tautonia sociabilis]